MGSSTSVANNATLSESRVRERIRIKILLSRKKYAINLSTKELLDRVFQETDKNGDGELDLIEFTKTAAILGLEATLSQIAQVFIMFDADGNGTISKQEFVQFITEVTNNTRRHTINGNTQLCTKSLLDEQETQILEEFSKQIDDFEGAEAFDSKKQRDWDYRNAKWELKMRITEKRVEKIRFSKDKFLLRRNMHLADVAGRQRQSVAGVDPLRNLGERRTKEAGFFESTAREGALQELQDVTRLSLLDALQILDFFKNPHQRKTSEAFVEFLLNLHPQLRSHKAVTLRIYSLFSTNGLVAAQEFCLGMIKHVRAAINDKILFLVSVSNLSSSHVDHDTISISRVVDVLNQLLKETKIHLLFAKSYLIAMDESGRGYITIDQLFDSLEKNTVLLESVVRSLPYPTPSLREIHRLGASKGCELEFSQLEDIWDNFLKLDSKQRKQSKRLDLRGFRDVFNSIFGQVTEKNVIQVDRLFYSFSQRTVYKPTSSFKSRKGHTVDLVQVLRGLAIVLAPSQKVLAKFYFRLFDENEDGRIDEEEIDLMMELSERHLAGDVAKVKRVLHEYERSHGPKVSSSQVVKLANKYPQLLGLLFHYLNK